MSEQGGMDLTLHLTSEMLWILDNWRRRQPDNFERKTAVMVLLQMALEEADLLMAETPEEL